MIDNKELWERYINDTLHEIEPKEEKIEKLTHKRVIFFGTPAIAKSALEYLMQVENIEVVAVVCQPDRELNRKKEIIFQPVKQFAIEKNIPLYQPEKIIEIKSELINLNPDAIITCAYGQFVPTSILEIPKYGAFNLHASLLPKLRGGAPIHWAIINQETKTGWTLMKMVKEMDAGDYCDQMVCEIEPNETMSSLYQKLSDLLEPFILFYLPRIFYNDTKWIQQNANDVTFAYNIKKEDRYLDFNLDAKSIDAKIRGLNAKPIALWNFKNLDIKVYEAQILDSNHNSTNKIISLSKDGILISTSTNDILLKVIQLPNKEKVEISQIYHNEFYKELFKD